MPPVVVACATQRRKMMCSLSAARGLALTHRPVLNAWQACFVEL